MALGAPDRVLALGWIVATVAMIWVIETSALTRPALAAPEASWADWAATGGIVGLANLVFAVYISVTNPDVLKRRQRVGLAMVLALLTLLGARVLGASTQALPHLELFVPVVFTATVLTVAVGPRFAAEGSGLMLFLTAYTLRHPFATAGFDAGPGLLGVLAVLGAGVLVAVLGARRIRTRSRLVKVGIAVGAAQAALVILFALPILGEYLNQADAVVTASSAADALALTAQQQGRLALTAAEQLQHQLQLAAWDAGFLLLHGLVLGLLLSGALPFIEYLFDTVTDISLLELSNQEHPLLRRLLLLAPGTFHHSFVVGNLVEAGAEAIGANSLLGRVGAYFHDIGKSVKPEYFTENEGRKGLKHGRLSPTLSALVIKAHTKDGIALAREYNLPEQIIDFIPQHHGTAVIEYFYHEAVSQEEAEGRRPEFVSRDAFRHDGPKTRSLTDPTPSRLRELTHQIIWRKLEDGQLDECDLTFADLRKVEEAFVRVLMGIFHTRIAYPQQRTGARR
jgi:putative nucleotidyltransferase with HDIG domain